MARIETDPNYSSPTFSRATAGTDIFKKEDVQSVAAALSTHDHSTGKGLAIGGASIPNGTITSAMIADGTIDTADLKDSSVTSAKIADGTIATADLANNAVTNQKLGTDTARSSLLTNGGFEIWQRGNGPFTTNGGFSADRWQIYIPQGTFSVSRDTANADSPSSFCAAITATGGTTPSAQQFYQYPFASADGGSGYQYAGRTLTVSARVKTTTANAVRLLLNPTGGTPAYSAYHSGGGTYQTLSATVTMPATVSAAILTIAINIEASCTAYLDNAMLVVGSVPADYAPLHPADDLARCLRYYEVFGANSNNDINFSAYCGAGQSFANTWRYMSPKPVVPTVTKVGTWLVTNCGQPIVAVAGYGSFVLYAAATATAQTAFSNGAAGALITIEGNP